MVGRILLLLSLGLLSCSQERWTTDHVRYWLGPHYWGNRLQDWQFHNGRIECVGGGLPLRTVHHLSRALAEKGGGFHLTVRTGLLQTETTDPQEGFRGFLLGAGSAQMDYRANALVHLGSGRNGGLIAAIDSSGGLSFLDNEKNLEPLPSIRTGENPDSKVSSGTVDLTLVGHPTGDTYRLVLSAKDSQTGGHLDEILLENVPAERLRGSFALVANLGADEHGRSFWFEEWEISGQGIAEHGQRHFGPIIAGLYTLGNGILKLTAQLAPVSESGSQLVLLQVQEGDAWRELARSEIVVPGWTAHFRIEGWDSSRDYPYRLVFEAPNNEGVLTEYSFEGTFRREPADHEEFVVAAFTGNSNSHGTFQRTFDFAENRIWYPHGDIVRGVTHHRPDLLVFTGDQVYEGRPNAPDRTGGLSSRLDYLYKWYLWCWAYQDLTRDTPVVCMPDDHDVYHGNIWGAGGKAPRGEPEDGRYPEHYSNFESHWIQDGGGYLMPPDFVRMVERTQTAHLPDPFDPTPVEQGIGVYYTALNYGRISFAILEDRKFKSPPSILIPEAKVVNGFAQVRDFDSGRLDVPEAVLLGERQLSFLRDWASDWRGVDMKIALSQTILANLSTYPTAFKTDAGTPSLEPLPFGVIPEDYELARDMDSNGWPQSGRNRALRELRKGFAFMIGGDQHLGSIIHHGVEGWEDAGISFCVPSIANLWPRRWYPPKKGENHQDGLPDYTGRYLDGFGNRMTVWAVSNPVISGQEPHELYDGAPGYGIVRLNRSHRTITMECWPRWVDPGAPGASQYPGWPRTVSLEDNYGQNASLFLPTLEFTGSLNPVVQVLREADGEVVYTVRTGGTSFRPKVLEEGVYTVRVEEPGTAMTRTFSGLRASSAPDPGKVTVDF